MTLLFYLLGYAIHHHSNTIHHRKLLTYIKPTSLHAPMVFFELPRPPQGNNGEDVAVDLPPPFQKKTSPFCRLDSGQIGIPTKLTWNIFSYLVVSTHLKNIRQNGNLESSPIFGVNIKNIWNHHLVRIGNLYKLSFATVILGGGGVDPNYNSHAWRFRAFWGHFPLLFHHHFGEIHVPGGLIGRDEICPFPGCDFSQKIWDTPELEKIDPGPWN